MIPLKAASAIVVTEAGIHICVKLPLTNAYCLISPTPSGILRSSISTPFTERVLPYSKVFDVSEAKTVVALHVVLIDELGALQSLLKLIAKYNISIVTITQSAPVDGTAAVSLTMKVRDMIGDVDSLVEEMNRQRYVVTAKRIMQDL